MKTIGVLPAASFLLAPCASWADVPVAVVEDVGGKPAGVDFMEIERVDVPSGDRLEIVIAPAPLVKGAFCDLAKDLTSTGKNLKPGGVSRAKVGGQQIVFEVDAGARLRSSGSRPARMWSR